MRVIFQATKLKYPAIDKSYVVYKVMKHFQPYLLKNILSSLFYTK